MEQTFPSHGRCLFSADTRAPYRFCGARTVGPEGAWCAEHRPRVYQTTLIMHEPKPAFEATVIKIRGK